MNSVNQVGEIKPLTSLRFIAATCVALHHLQGVLFIPAGFFDPYKLGNAVSFFFVLSGFILTYSYHERIAQLGARAFILLRIARIWPLHIAALVLTFFWFRPQIFVYQVNELALGEVLKIVFLVQAWTPDQQVFWGLNGPSWTISVEMFFYILFPLLLLGCTRYFWGMLVGSMALLFAYFVGVGLIEPNPTQEEIFGLGAISPLVRLPEFVFGILLGLWAVRSTNTARFSSVGNRAVWTAAEVFVIALVIWSNGKLGWISGIVTDEIGPMVGAWAHATFVAPAYLLTIYVFFVGRGYISQFLSLPVFLWLGTISFAEYLIHKPIIHFWDRNLDPVLANPPLSVALFTVLLISISAVLFYSVERPCLRFAKARVKPKARSQQLT